jgi:predicted  nucleic acid-binding Zn-ribbon protein
MSISLLCADIVRESHALELRSMKLEKELADAEFQNGELLDIIAELRSEISSLKKDMVAMLGRNDELIAALKEQLDQVTT